MKLLLKLRDYYFDKISEEQLGQMEAHRNSRNRVKKKVILVMKLLMSFLVSVYTVSLFLS